MTLPKPYYRDDAAGITIYNRDAREVVPFLDQVDLTLTDPPYGIQGGIGGASKARGLGNYEGAFTSAMDTPEYIRTVVQEIIGACLKISSALIVTPGNKNMCAYPQPDSFGCLWTPHGTGAQRWGWTDSQPVFYYGKSPLQGVRLEPSSFHVTKQDDCNFDHPCPKPYTIWKKLLMKGLGGGGGRA